MRKIYLFITLISTSCFFGQTNYLVENFDYPAAALLSANGWYIHSATANSTAVNNGGLTWTGYIGSGVGNAALVNNTGVDVNKPLAGNITDGAAYASFLFKPSAAITSTGTGDYFFHFVKYSNETTPVYTATNTSYRGRVFVIQGTNTATQFKLGLNFNASAYIAPSNVTADLDITKTYLVVVKYKFNTGDFNDEVSLFVFAEGDAISTEPATPTLGPFTATPASPPAALPLGDDAGTIQGVALRQATLGQNAIVDGIYVRKVWNLTSPGTALSVDKFEKNTLKVYPNPAQNNRVSIYSSIAGEKEITLTDMSGKVVLKKTMTSDELDLTTVNKGVYLLQTKVGAATTTTKLIVN
ncbi:T9SS type A sorting domain-containing protein [Flavobacterium nackdongense]|uniref:T9SS type A sorting domain-containing protein n=1 Tax=Flavobacterium nackdongense TaxID=2547394 RepID=A0A4P6Y5W2_9FLAO|nr:T9SS type A sorting domain-containing protein [Flavobacterium nackdongense]QBN17616.1 T9SS type A sorting domain-containing protein [Flavobacterium nackdongense]